MTGRIVDEAPELPRRTAVSPAAFAREHVAAGEPVVLEGAVADWPAVGAWDLAFFRERLGARRIEVDGVEFRLDELLDRVAASTVERPAPYLRSRKLRDEFPELLADLRLPHPLSTPNWPASRLLPRQVRRLVSPELLLGGRGAGFPVLHYDVRHLHAFVAQIHGRKDFVLFSPEQTRLLYPRADAPNKSEIADVFHPDFERYPLLREARPVRATLQPGDLLFVPAGHWHTTWLPEVSISVTWNFASQSNWRDFVADTAAHMRARGKHAWLAPAFASYARALGAGWRLRSGVG